MKKILKFLLVVIVWLLIVIASVVVSVLLTSEYRSGLWIAGSLFVLWLAFLVIRRLIIRHNAKKRVENLVNVEKPEGDKKLPKFIFNLLSSRSRFSLAEQFHNLIKLLNKSDLKRHGDPLYVLPWYLMLEDEKSAASRILEKAHLPAPVFDVDLQTTTGSVFVPYNQAIMINTSEDFVTADTPEAREERSQLIQLLQKYRNREPLNGIVIAKDLRSLLQSDSVELQEEGKLIRARIDEVMRGLKISIPVYLMVTNSESLGGFPEWAQLIPDHASNQPMGYAQADSDLEADQLISEAMQAIVNRIKDFMIESINSHGADARLLRLPTRFEKLESSLQAFAKGAFESNPYQESIQLKGIYLTANKTVTNKTGEDEVRGLFSHKFFTDILPRDRAMISTLSGAEKIGSFSRKLVFGGWSTFIVLLLIVLGWSYTSNLKYLRDTTTQNAGSFVHQVKANDNVEMIYNLRMMVSSVDNEVSSWWLPWFSFGGEPEFITKMKSIFVERFKLELLYSIDQHYIDELDKFLAQQAQASDKEAPSVDVQHKTARLVDMLVRRINILEAYKEGADENDLMAMPAPFAPGELVFEDGTLIRDTEVFNQLYLYSLVWSGDPEGVQERIDLFRSYLMQMLQHSQNDLQWIIPLANRQVERPAELDLNDYWIGSGAIVPSVRIDPAYSLAGKAFLDDYLARLLDTDPHSEALKEMKARFEDSYRLQYFENWRVFIQDFNRGLFVMRNREEWLNMIDRLSIPSKNPYFRFLNVMHRHMEPFMKEGETSEWLDLVDYYQQMVALAPANEADTGSDNKALTKMILKVVKKLGPVGKAIAGAGKKGMKAQKKLGIGKSSEERDAVLEQAGQSLGEYHKALTDIAFNAAYRTVSYQSMVDIFSNPQNPGAGTGPEARIYTSIHTLQQLIGKETADNEPFWELYKGSQDVVREFMLKEAACQLQKKWQENFLVEIEGVPEYKLVPLIFSEEGPLWQFMSTEAAPFIKKAYGKGYVPTKVQGLRLPLRAEFVEFVSKGRDSIQEERDSYSVNFETIPTNANPEAIIKPSLTTISLHCSNQLQTLNNYNYAASQTFSWSQKNCGDVVFRIKVGQYVLEKVYRGSKAFPQFLKDHRFGYKRYTPDDFPRQKKNLEDLRIKYIDVRYNISGHEPVIATLNKVSFSPPKQIVSCWN